MDYNLIPFLSLKTKLLAEQLKPASWNQTQITDASQLIVFANYNNLDETIIDNYINRKLVILEKYQQKTYKVMVIL